MTASTQDLFNEVRTKRLRGKEKGGKFFVLDRELWSRACLCETVDRMNLLTVLLVMLAGTGADHRLTKWSAKACEKYAGMGKPRARVAINELIAAELLHRTESWTRERPQYGFAGAPASDEPIFLPMQLVTGFHTETPILRRVRETGDPLLLRMLVDLYGEIQSNATCAAPPGSFKRHSQKFDSGQKVGEVGVHAVWAFALPDTRHAGGEWAAVHRAPDVPDAEQLLWTRLRNLERIGAIWFESCIFSSDQGNAEPHFPVSNEPDTVEADLTKLARNLAMMLMADCPNLIKPYEQHILAVLPVHHSPPALREVLRVRIQADTPGARAGYGKRQNRLAGFRRMYLTLFQDLQAGRKGNPLVLPTY